MKTALITGAASGIGRATARRLSAGGWRVYATDVDADRLAGLDGPETLGMDVTDADDVARIEEHLGGEVDGLDCLVVGAGFGQLGPVADLPPARLDEQLRVNVVGAHRTVATLLPLVEARGGTAVVLSSTHGRVTTPGMGAYAASKHALEGLFETLHAEMADRPADVVLLEPAWVRTAFARTSERTLASGNPDSPYADVYDAMAEGTLLGGGPLALSPEQVAARIERVASAEDPPLRVPVGLPARLILATRWLPRSVHTWIQRALVGLFAAVHRFGGARR